MMNFDILARYFPITYSKIAIFGHINFSKKRKRGIQMSAEVYGTCTHSYLPYPHRGKPSFLDSISTAADIQVRRV